MSECSLKGDGARMSLRADEARVPWPCPWCCVGQMLPRRVATHSLVPRSASETCLFLSDTHEQLRAEAIK